MFASPRFVRLVRAHWAESWRRYAWMFGVAIILHFVILAIGFSDDNLANGMSRNGQEGVYFFGWFVLATVFAGRHFQAMSRRDSAVLFLMQPASAIEKWLLAVLVIVIGFPVAYTAAYYVCDLPAVALARMQLASTKAAGEMLPFLPWRDVPAWQWVSTGLVTLQLQGLAVLGSLYFRKSPFIKTVVASFGCIMLIVLIASRGSGDPDLYLGFWRSPGDVTSSQRVLIMGAWLGTPLLLWLASLFALQEREMDQ